MQKSLDVTQYLFFSSNYVKHPKPIVQTKNKEVPKFVKFTTENNR
jgi:hypothetical protein